MTDLNDQTLAQIVRGNHRTAAVFEKYELDFCCKGKRSLQQACVEHNIPVDTIVNELTAVSTPSPGGSCQVVIPFDKLTLTQLADYIVAKHHAYTKTELPQIYSYMQKVASKHGQRHLELFRIFEIVGEITADMDLHMKKEEEILFPAIKELEKISKEEVTTEKPGIRQIQSPISVMEQEHDHAGELMKDIRTLSNNYQPPADACTTYALCYASLKAFEIDLHQHIHLENNILFPKAIELHKTLTESTLN